MVKSILAGVASPADMATRERAFKGARSAYAASLARGEAPEQAIALAIDRAIRTLQGFEGAREIAALAVRVASRPTTLALATPDVRALPAPRPAMLPAAPRPACAPAPASRRRAARLPRAAYVSAATVRLGLAPDLVGAFDEIWRGLWADRGRATLGEAFAEWTEAHPAELLQLQCDAAERATKRLVREVDREHRRVFDAYYEVDERAAIAEE